MWYERRSRERSAKREGRHLLDRPRPGVEFVRGSGETQALVTLKKRDLRRIKGDELLSVRPLGRGRPRPIERPGTRSHRWSFGPVGGESVRSAALPRCATARPL